MKFRASEKKLEFTVTPVKCEHIIVTTKLALCNANRIYK